MGINTWGCGDVSKKCQDFDISDLRHRHMEKFGYILYVTSLHRNRNGPSSVPKVMDFGDVSTVLAKLERPRF